MSKPCGDPLDEYVDHMDIVKWMNGGETATVDDAGYGLNAAFRLLDEKPPERGNADAKTVEELKKYAAELMEDYGRGYTQTLTDEIIKTYTEGFIIKAMRKMLNACCDKFVVIPDYSPTDGRLHFHGVITFGKLKDVAKLRKLSKPFGWTSIDTDPKASTPEYIVKIYQQNKYTPPNTRIEKLPMKNIIKK